MDVRGNQQRRRIAHVHMVVQSSNTQEMVWIVDTLTKNEPTIPVMAMKLASTAKQQPTSQVVGKEKEVHPHAVEKFHSQPERVKQLKSLCLTMTLICSTRTICQIS
eukprot:6613025-Karenia_brevis.AAC.1